MVPKKNMEYEEYLAKANSGAFQAASPGPPSGKTIAGKRGVNITTLLKRLPEGDGRADDGGAAVAAGRCEGHA